MSDVPSSEPPYTGQTVFRHDEKIAVIELSQNGFSLPIEYVPEGWGRMIICHNTILDWTAPGPFSFESAPLRQGVQAATAVYIELFHLTFSGDFEPQREPHVFERASRAIYGVVREGGTVLLVKTRWEWLAPWEAEIQRLAQPGTTVTVMGTGDPRQLCFRAEEKPPAKRRRS